VFVAAQLSLEKFRNALNYFCSWRPAWIRRKKGNQPNWEIWKLPPACTPPLSPKVLSIAPDAGKQQSAISQCFFASSAFSCQRNFKLASATTAHSTHPM
jgi:hypothetical protein